MHIIRSETFGATLARLFGAKSLAKSLTESLGDNLSKTHSETLGESFHAKASRVESRRESRIGLYASLSARHRDSFFYAEYCYSMSFSERLFGDALTIDKGKKSERVGCVCTCVTSSVLVGIHDYWRRLDKAWCPTPRREETIQTVGYT